MRVDEQFIDMYVKVLEKRRKCVNLKPLYNNVIIEKEKEPEEVVSEGGLVLPQERQYSTEKNEGKVLAIGPDCVHVKVGDVALYAKYATREEGDVIVVREDDILCVRT